MHSQCWLLALVGTIVVADVRPTLQPIKWQNPTASCSVSPMSLTPDSVVMLSSSGGPVTAGSGMTLGAASEVLLYYTLSSPQPLNCLRSATLSLAATQIDSAFTGVDLDGATVPPPYIIHSLAVVSAPPAGSLTWNNRPRTSNAPLAVQPRWQLVASGAGDGTYTLETFNLDVAPLFHHVDLNAAGMVTTVVFQLSEWSVLYFTRQVTYSVSSTPPTLTLAFGPQTLPIAPNAPPVMTDDGTGMVVTFNDAVDFQKIGSLPGVSVDIYTQIYSFAPISDFTGLTPKLSWVAPTFSNATVDYQWFTVRQSTWLRIPTTGTYSFSVTSDDGVLVWIDEVFQPYLSWTWTRAPTGNETTMHLNAGYVNLTFSWSQGIGGYTFIVQWKPPGQADFIDVDPSMLFAMDWGRSTHSVSPPGTWAQTRDYCLRRGRDLASIHDFDTYLTVSWFAQSSQALHLGLYRTTARPFDPVYWWFNYQQADPIWFSWGSDPNEYTGWRWSDGSNMDYVAQWAFDFVDGSDVFYYAAQADYHIYSGPRVSGGNEQLMAGLCEPEPGARSPQSFPCYLVFTQASLAALGSAPQCSFINPRTLLVTFGSMYRISASKGDSTLGSSDDWNALTLGGWNATYSGMIGNFGSGANQAGIQPLTSANTQITAVYMAPSFGGTQPNMVTPSVGSNTPVAVLSGPTLVGSCDKLTIDGRNSYGFAGKPGIFQWSLLAGVGTDTSTNSGLSTWLSALSTSTTTLTPPRALITPGNTYTFGLTVMNALNITSAPKQIEVEISPDVIPLLVLRTPAKLFAARDSRFGVSLSFTKGCVGVTSKWSYNWQFTGPGSTNVILGTLATVKDLWLPANTFAVGVYTISLTASDAHGVTVSTTGKIRAEPSPPIAFITGGSRAIVVGTGACITLDGSLSSASDPYPLQYDWTCSTIDPSNGVIIECPFALPSIATQCVPADQFTAGSSYNVQLIVTSTYNFFGVMLSDIVSITLDAVNGTSNATMPAVVEVSRIGINQDAVLNSVAFLGEVTRFTAVTSFGNPLLPVPNQNLTFLWSVSGLNGPVIISSSALPNTFNFVIPTDGIKNGGSYTVHVDVTHPDFQAFGTFQLVVVEPPYGGTFSLTQPPPANASDPTYDETMRTGNPFLVECDGWVDSTQQPLIYTFKIIPRNEVDEVPLSAPQTAASLSVLLPYGDITVVAYISNKYGLSTRVTIPASIGRALPELRDDICDLARLNATLTAAIWQGSPSIVLNVLFELATSLEDIEFGGSSNDTFTTPCPPGYPSIAPTNALFTRQLQKEILDNGLRVWESVDPSQVTPYLLEAVTALLKPLISLGYDGQVTMQNFLVVMDQLIGAMDTLQQQSAVIESSTAFRFDFMEVGPQVLMSDALQAMLKLSQCNFASLSQIYTRINQLLRLNMKSYMAGEVAPISFPNLYYGQGQRQFANSSGTTALNGGAAVTLPVEALTLNQTNPSTNPLAHFMDSLIVMYQGDMDACFPKNLTNGNTLAATGSQKTRVSNVYSMTVMDPSHSVAAVQGLAATQPVVLAIPLAGPSCNSDYGIPISQSKAAQTKQSYTGVVNNSDQLYECAWWDATTQSFSTAGCVVASVAYNVYMNGNNVVTDTTTTCNCTHLTDFAVLLKTTRTGVCDPLFKREIQVHIAFTVLYCLLAILAVVQITRIFLATKSIRKLWGAGDVLWQHILLFIASFFRCLLSGIRVGGDKVPMTTLAQIPILAIALFAECVSYVFLITRWASIYHFSMQSPNNPFKKIRTTFIAINIFIAALLIGVLTSFGLSAKKPVAAVILQIASGLMGVVFFIMSIGILAYGFLILRELKPVSKHSSDAHTKLFRFTVGTIVAGTCYLVASVLNIVITSMPSQFLNYNGQQSMAYFGVTTTGYLLDWGALFALFYLFFGGVNRLTDEQKKPHSAHSNNNISDNTSQKGHAIQFSSRN